MRLFFRFKGTVLQKIWWQVLLYTIFCAIIVILHKYVIEFKFNQILIGLLAAVLGLLLGFRSSTAYEKYSEGRKVWSGIQTQVRTLTRVFWLYTTPKTGADIVQKKTALNLLVAYPFALKHYVRNEFNYDYDDMKHLLNGGPRFAGSASPIKFPKILDQTIVAYDVNTPTNIPLEICYQLLGYLKTVIANGTFDPTAVMLANLNLQMLGDNITSLEKIVRTPIPLAYAAHLYHILAIYLLTLPFQMVTQLGWFTIPCLAFTSFCLLGILQIGWELEIPFGYDPNDLPLDDFCWKIKAETEQITATRFHDDVEEWMMSEDNLPLYPYSKENAIELSQKSMEEVQKMLRDAGVVAPEKQKTRKEWLRERKPKGSRK